MGKRARRRALFPGVGGVLGAPGFFDSSWIPSTSQYGPSTDEIVGNVGWAAAANSFLPANFHQLLRERPMGLGTFGVGSTINPWTLGLDPNGGGGGGGGFGGVNWGDVLIGGANVVGAYFDRKQQRKLLKQQARMQQMMNMGGGNPFLNTNPNLGGVAGQSLNFGSLTPSGASSWGDLAAWQTAPVDPGGLFGGAVATNAGLPAVLAPGVVGGTVATIGRIGGPLLRTLMKYMAPAAAAALITDLIEGGVTAGGPYRTESANKAIAYRGDLAACKRLRAAGKAIGYARATGVRRGSVRRRRRC